MEEGSRPETLKSPMKLITFFE